MNKQKPNYYMIASIVLLLTICFLSGYLIKDKIDSKPKDMTQFYNFGFNQGASLITNAYCDNGIIEFQGQKIPLVKLCEK
jgi:hypothetical protein